MDSFGDMDPDEAEQRSALHYDPSVDPERVDRRELVDLLVRRASVAFEELRTQLTTRVDLGTHERMAVTVLWIHGPMQMSELASRIGMSRAAVTTLVDRLEADGWMRRTNDPHDRRRTILVLEKKFVETCGAIAEVHTGDLQKLADTFDDREWQAIARFLDGWYELSLRQADKLRTGR